MEVIIFEKESYYRMLAEVLAFVKKQHAEENLKVVVKSDDEWLDHTDVFKLLNIKKTKLQQLRSNGVIQFSKFGRKIKYSKKSVLTFLNKNIR